ncbi:MAG: hypothetical protein KatS3mg015_1382 [Fimbriimonadales bacterium]|nr:MAG: hypothetical protein KatS3mg015_1382 [Fimbriimonadales bacterium]
MRPSRPILGVLLLALGVVGAVGVFAWSNVSARLPAPEVPQSDTREAEAFLQLLSRVQALLQGAEDAPPSAEFEALVADLDALASLPEDRMTFAAIRYPDESSRLKPGLDALRNLVVRRIRSLLRGGQCEKAAQLAISALRIASAAGRTGHRDDVLQFALMSQALAKPLAWMVDHCDKSALQLMANGLPQIVESLPSLEEALEREQAAVSRALADPRVRERLREDYDLWGQRPGHGEMSAWAFWAYGWRKQIKALEKEFQRIRDIVDEPFAKVGPAFQESQEPLVVRLGLDETWREQMGLRQRAASRLLLIALESARRAGVNAGTSLKDPLTGEPFHQRKDGTWYSLGVDGLDQGGQPGDVFGDGYDLVYRDYVSGKPAEWSP